MNIKEEMKNSYVAFIDVLGFKNLVYDANTEKLQSFFNIALDELETQNDADNLIDSTIISDSIVLISPKNEEGFIKLIKTIQNIQTRFIMEDIWIRGAVSFGETCFLKEKNIVLGEGLISAYLLEKQAKYPRVIIDSRIIRIIGTDSSNFLDIVNGSYEIIKEEKRIKLIHPIGGDIENDSYYVEYAEKLITDAMLCNDYGKLYNIIKNNMYKEHAYFSKYYWVQQYLYGTMLQLGFLERYLADVSREKRCVFFEWRGKFGDL